MAEIERALEGGRAARRHQVEALEARGIDPRLGWTWDAGAGDWIWDPGPAMAGERAERGSAGAPWVGAIRGDGAPSSVF